MDVSRRAACQALLAGSLGGQAPAPSRKPNVIVILADDLGYGDIGCYGAPDVRTPHIDAMAAAGARFTDGYVSAAVCSPSRAALLTGRCQQRFGHEFNPGSAEREAEIGFGLPASEKILPQYLQPAGYTSAIIGKWHLGSRPGFHPLDRGFDEFYGFLGGANDYLTSTTPGGRAAEKGSALPSKRVHPILRGRAEAPEPRYLTDAFADEAVQFIERNRRRPFFLYLALNAVHSPLHATERYWNRFAGIRNERRRMMAAMASAMDDAAGAVVRKVRECGLERDSLIFFPQRQWLAAHERSRQQPPAERREMHLLRGWRPCSLRRGVAWPYSRRQGLPGTGNLPRHPAHRAAGRGDRATAGRGSGRRRPAAVPGSGQHARPA